jgi:hypothetical protein
MVLDKVHGDGQTASPSQPGRLGATGASRAPKRKKREEAQQSRWHPWEAHMAKTELLALRRRFAGLRESAHRQMALRAIKDALALEGRNPARESELAAKAAFYLPYAEAAR